VASLRQDGRVEECALRKLLVLRWIGLGLATLGGAWWRTVGVGRLVAEEEPLTIEGALLGVLFAAALAGVGWWRA
jgi:hypothetical protein